MDHHISPVKTGFAIGVFFAVAHAAWAALIALGLAQTLTNFIFWAHMFSLPFVVKAFDATAAATLIAVTFVIGYIVGYIFAIIWNWLHR